MLNVICPSCSAQYELPDEDAGTQAECACGHLLDIVPDATGGNSAAQSDSIPVVCDACGGQYDLGVEDAGTQVECPCGQVLTVPAVGGLETPPVPAGATSIPVTCPSCGGDYELGLEDAGTQVQCPCGEVIQVPTADSPVEPEPDSNAVAATESGVASWTGPIPVTCPSCNAQYELAPEDAGTQAECACGTILDIPSTPPAEAKPDPKPRKKRRSVEIQKPEKADRKNSWIVPGLIGGVSLVLIIALFVVLNRGPSAGSAGKSGTGQSAEFEIPPGKQAADPATWQGWVSEKTVAAVFVRPARLMGSKLLKELPVEGLSEMVKATAGFDPQAVEEVVAIVDPPGEGAVEAEQVVFIKFTDRANRRDLLNALLPDGEPVSTRAGTWFRGAVAGLFFPNEQTVVYANGALLEATLPKLHTRYLPDNPLFKQIEDAARSNGVDAHFTQAGLRLVRDQTAPSATFVDPITSVTLSMSLSNGSLLDALVTTADAAAAEATEKQILELKQSLITTAGQFAAGLAVVDASETSTTGESGLSSLLETLLSAINVYRTDASLTVQLRAPFNLNDLLKQSAPQLAAISEMVGGRIGSQVAEAAAAPSATAENKAGTTVEAMKPASKITFPKAPQERYRVYSRAYDRFIEVYTEAEELKKKIAAAEKEQKPALRRQRLQKLAEATGVLREAERLAVKLADGTGDRENLLQARYLLAYLYTELNLHYEAGMLAAYVARLDPPDSKRALQAAFLSLMSWQNAYQEAAGNDRLAERDEFVKAATLLDQRWPDDPQLERIRYTVGQVLQIDDESEAAGDWFAKVGESAEQYAEAQVTAGQAYWRAYKALGKEARAWRKQRETELDSEVVHINGASVPGPEADSPESDEDESETPGEVVPESESSTEPPADPQPPAVAESPAPTSATPVVDTDIYADRLERLMTLAERHLESGVTLMQMNAPPLPESVEPAEPANDSPPAETPPTASSDDGEAADGTADEASEGLSAKPAPDVLVAAKLSLSEVRLRKGDGAGALELLTVEPWSVMTAISVEEEEKRPPKGIQSRAFATAAYQLLLRATVAERQLEKAREAMETLEVVAGANDAARLTAVYLQLGDELMEELEAAEESRAAEVRAAFASFLSVMAERKQQTFGSLLWIAETNTALGDSETTRELSQPFHSGAARAYESIIERAGQDRDFCSAKTVSAIRIRLAKSLRRGGDYERAIQIFAGLLTLSPNSYSMQFEAAAAIEEWGATTDDKDRLLEAIRGRGDSLWGWGRISITLQRRLEADNAKPEYRDMMLDARHHVASCRRQWALSQTDDNEKTESLEKALQAIRTTAQIAESLDGEGWDRLDELYQTLQRDLGQTPESIRDQVSASVPE